MRYKNYLFISLIILGLIFLSGVAHYKNNERKIGQIIIDFKNDGTGFISPDIVNKLLIQKKGELPWEAKDSLDLNMLETFLENNPYVLKAEVFSFPEGILGINIQEKQAIVRVKGEKTFYLDKFGTKLPLSKSYLPKVPTFVGELNEISKKGLLSLIYFFNKDPFLKSELITIYYKSDNFYIKLRSFDFEVEIGDMTQLQNKLQRLKIFCAYQMNSKLEKKFKLISLKFKNQIVGS